MIRVLLKTFVEKKRDGRSVTVNIYDNYPRTEQELFELKVPSDYDCIVIHRVSKNTVNVCLIKKEFDGEEIIL